MAEHSDNFHIQVVTTKDRVTRILISERVRNELPIIEPMLERLVASDHVEWPRLFVIAHHDEPRPNSSNLPTIILPPWVFERMQSKWSKPRSRFERMIGFRVIDRATHDFGWLFAQHFKTRDDLKPMYAAYDAQFAAAYNTRGDKASFRRSVRLFLGFVPMFLLYLPFTIVRAYVMAKLKPTNRDALFRLANVQLILFREKALRRTQLKLIAAGASPEDVRKFDPQPDLQITDKNGQESE